MDAASKVPDGTTGRRRIDGDVVLAVVIGLTFVTVLFQAPFTELKLGGNNTLVRWWDLAYLLLLATSMVYAVRRRTTSWSKVRRVVINLKDPLFWALVLVAIAALSLIWAWIDFGSSGFVAETMRVLRLAGAILLACLIRYGFKGARIKNVAPISVIVIATISAFWAWAAWLTLTNDSFSVTRAGGPFGNQFGNGLSDHSWVSSAASNNVGFLIAVAFAVALVWGIRSWKVGSHREALVWTTATIVLVGGLVATHSRESMVAALFAALVVGGVTSRRTGWELVVAAIAFGAVILILLILVVPSFGDRFLESFNPGSFEYRTGPEARFDAWLKGLEWGVERFPIGYGIGAIEEHPRQFNGATSENVFIQAWAQIGLVGLVALLALVVTAIRNSANVLHRSASLSSAFSLSFFAAFAVHGQFGNTLWDPTLLLVFGVALAFAGPASDEQPDPDAAPPRLGQDDKS